LYWQSTILQLELPEILPFLWAAFQTCDYQTTLADCLLTFLGQHGANVLSPHQPWAKWIPFAINSPILEYILSGISCANFEQLSFSSFRVRFIF
jgi:hypothetical protein